MPKKTWIFLAAIFCLRSLTVGDSAVAVPPWHVGEAASYTVLEKFEGEDEVPGGKRIALVGLDSSGKFLLESDSFADTSTASPQWAIQIPMQALNPKQLVGFWLGHYEALQAPQWTIQMAGSFPGIRWFGNNPLTTFTLEDELMSNFGTGQSQQVTVSAGTFATTHFSYSDSDVKLHNNDLIAIQRADLWQSSLAPVLGIVKASASFLVRTKIESNRDKSDANSSRWSGFKRGEDFQFMHGRKWDKEFVSVEVAWELRQAQSGVAASMITGTAVMLRPFVPETLP